MPTTTYENGNKTLVITAGVQLDSAHPDCIQLLQAINDLDTVVSLTRFRVRQLGGPNEYRYTWDTSDGRMWKQDIRCTPNQEAEQKINCPDWFKLTEFETHREPRRIAIGLIQDHGVTEIDCIWS